MNTSTTQYQYLPLEIDHIRILNLELANDRAAPLRFSLQTVHIDEAAGKYEAISYCWGTPIFPRKIYISDKSKPDTYLAITDSLHGALCRFRLLTKARRLWADAVCICQTDDDAKSTQIPLMSKVYEWASQVLVWLGEGNPEMETALHDLACVSRGTIRRVSGNSHPFTILPFIEYFGRRWIIQEPVLNIDVQLFYGDTQTSWPRFCAPLGQIPHCYNAPSPPGFADDDTS